MHGIFFSSSNNNCRDKLFSWIQLFSKWIPMLLYYQGVLYFTDIWLLCERYLCTKWFHYNPRLLYLKTFATYFHHLSIIFTFYVLVDFLCQVSYFLVQWLYHRVILETRKNDKWITFVVFSPAEYGLLGRLNRENSEIYCFVFPYYYTVCCVPYNGR